MSQKKKHELDETIGELQEIEQAIHFASQATQEQKRDNADLQRFEQLLAQLQIQEQLKFQSNIKKNAKHFQKETKKLKSPLAAVEKLLQVALKNEEQCQIHELGQRALDTASMSLALQTSKTIDKNAIKCDYELMEDSIELIKVTNENLELEERLRRMDSELLQLQSECGMLKSEIVRLKQHPETEKGTQTEKIQRLEASLDKVSGRYDFTRFLTQLLLMASEEDLNGPKISELFVKCGKAAN